jgi:hypothetical protein
MRDLPRGREDWDPHESGGWNERVQSSYSRFPYSQARTAYAASDYTQTRAAMRRGSFGVHRNEKRSIAAEPAEIPDDFVRDLPRLRRRRRNLAPVAVAFLALLLLAFGVVVLAAAQSEDGPVQTARLEAPPAPQWIDVVRPIEIFSLDAPDFAKDTKIYRARRHRDGGGREDMLGFGQLSGKESFLRLMIYRIGTETAPQVSFYVDLARRAAAAELSIGRSVLPQVDTTRFGPVEVADLDLVGRDGTTTPCLGFRGSSEAPIKMVGFACGTKDKPLSRPGLTCIIERLDLNSAGEDVALARFFSDSEMKRSPACAGTALGPLPARANWLDQADAQPPLRTKKSR